MHRSEIPIVHPCPVAKDWSKLSGDDQKRFCGQCSRHVHDLSAMDEHEARDLVAREHVCVRYTVDRTGRILHGLGRAALTLTAALAATSAHASGSVATDPDPPEPGWLPWLAERASAWWSPAPEVVAPVVPPLAPPPPPVAPPFEHLRPHQVLGGVPRRAPPPAPRPVQVDVRTSQPHLEVESSCCGRASFEDGRAMISVGQQGYVELVGEPSTRVRASEGDLVVCTDDDGQPKCVVTGNR